MNKLAPATLGLALGLCASAHASLNHGDTANGVSIPSFTGNLNFGVTGIYFEPNYARNHLAIIDASYENEKQDRSLVDVDFDHSYGYGLQVGYQFCHTGNDIQLSYFQTNADADKSVSEPNGGLLFPLATTPDYLEYAADAHGDISLKHYHVDLAFGQSLFVGRSLMLRLFAGLSYANLDQKFNARAVRRDEEDQDKQVDNFGLFKSDFSGWGPKFGINGNYCLGHGFGVVGSIASAVYIGEASLVSDIRQFDIFRGQPDLDDTISAKYEANHFVPALDIKLGLDYTLPFGCNRSVTIEAGYWANHYFDALPNLQFVDDVHQALNTYQLDDVTFHGVYASLNATF